MLLALRVLPLFVLVAYVLSYVMAIRVARRSQHFGGGTSVLAWLGFCVPCLAWIALIQGYLALNRSHTEAQTAVTKSNLSQFYRWVVVYVIVVLVSGAVGRAAEHERQQQQQRAVNVNVTVH